MEIRTWPAPFLIPGLCQSSQCFAGPVGGIAFFFDSRSGRLFHKSRALLPTWLLDAKKSKTNEAVLTAVYDGFKSFTRELVRPLTEPDAERLLQERMRRISLFDIEHHRREIGRLRAELTETRRRLKNLLAYAIRHLRSLLEKYGPLCPRRTRCSRDEDVGAREAAFKACKVAYDRNTGYLGYKVNGEEFQTECTKFDRFLMVFRDGHYKVIERPE